jgi:tetratricopeptide (TPR) repeat protein
MSVDTIRMALGRLQDDPVDDGAWAELEGALMAPGDGPAIDDVERHLDAARAMHEQRRDWGAVARLLELELLFAGGGSVETAMQAELARIYHDELIEPKKAAGAYKRLLSLRPDDPSAAEILAQDEAKRAKWRDLVQRYLSEAQGASDDAFKSALMASAADVVYRYGRDEESAGDKQVLELVEEALVLDRKNRRAAALAELVYTARKDWANVARVQEIALADAAHKDDRVAAGLRLGRTASKRLGDAAKATDAFERVLDLAPGAPEALSYLAESYSSRGDWDRLVALYEDQLRGGGVKPAEELGILVQIAMVHWRMRENAAAAEPYFDRVRRQDPAHAGMLSFFREFCLKKGDKARLATILTDAQRAIGDGPEKRDLATEIAKLAESQENATKAIEQYKNVLRTDPDNRDARDALKRLYTQTEGWNALVELHRQDLERTPATDVAARVAILRDIATIYRERAKNDAALVTVLTQIAQLDEKDAEAIRELVRVYEALGRWRDLLAYQQRLADLSENGVERVNLYRSAARRWLQQFSNVQNAIHAYECLFDVDPSDDEAQQKLKELYQKRRAWPQLFALHEKQLARAEGDAAKIELLTEMAKLAGERLDRGADAIALFKRVLEIDPAPAAVFDALEKLADREKDHATLAEVLEKRVDTAPDAPTRIAMLQKLGDVYAQRVKDPAAAARTWRRVLDVAPGHPRALRVLRESYVAAGDWDGLEQLYASQSDWEGLVEFLSNAADKAAEPQTKLEVSFRAARVFEVELKAPERAARSYERVLTVDANDARAAAALVPIYEKEEKWARLPALYEVLLGATEDVGKRVAMLRKLAAVTGGPLADKATALGYARRAYELEPDAEGLELLEAWARAAGSWSPFVEAVEARLKRKGKKAGLDPETRRSLRMKLADVYARELGKIDESVAAYRDLVELDPTDEETIRKLDELLRANGKKDDLRWLFQLRADQVAGEARAEIFEEWAGLEEEVFGDRAASIELLRKVVDLAPRRGGALKSLSRLLAAAGDHASAAEIVARHRDVSEGEHRARREVELAGLYLDHLDRPADALDACVRALEVTEHDADAIQVLASLLAKPETRVRAATVLEAEYAATGDARREAEVLRILLEAEVDPSKRLEHHLRLADVEQNKLSAPGSAFEVVLRALNEKPGDLELWDRAASLAQTAGRPTDLAEAYRTHLTAAKSPDGPALPEDVEIALCERAASLHDEQLGDPEGATPYLVRVLAIAPTNARAFARLKAILTAAERWSELEELYATAVKGTAEVSARIDLLNEVALVAEDIMGDPAKAIGYFESILGLDATYAPALDALEKLYERQEKWGDLAALLERRLETAPSATAGEMKLRLGRIYIDKLAAPEKALGHLEDVLRVHENDVDARQLVERLLEVPELRLRAARVLEAVYLARDEFRQLVRVLDILREGATEEADRRDLLRRVAALRDERLRDDAGAFAALAELVPLEPDDVPARSRLVEIGRRLGEHDKVAEVLGKAADACGSPPTAGEILMEVARIAEDLLGDSARAEKVYRRVTALDPGDSNLVIPAAQALGRIYAAQGKHDALAEVLGIEVKLEADAEKRRALYERIGTLHEEVLTQPEQAIEAWRARLADDPTDAAALAALERLYERTEKWRDLVGVFHARQAATEDGEERRRTMTRAAEVLAAKLADVPEATQAWRAVLDEFGPERPTLAALEDLYELAERWADLAETLEVDLSLAEETADRLQIWTRLGDVRRLHQDDLPGALEAYREALQLDPSSERCRKALEALLDVADARREAAAILRPLHEADGDSEKLLRVLEIEVQTSTEPESRLETLMTALRTAEGPLNDPTRAFEYAVRGVREAAGESNAATWIALAERLAEATGRWVDLCELYGKVVDEILDGDVQQTVRLRIGELARTRLSQRPLAIDQYRKALESRADDRRAMIALEEIYAESGDSKSLLDTLTLRVEHAESDAEKKALLFRIADLRKGPLDDQPGAISTYEAILDVELDPAAVRALEALYLLASRYNDVVALYERELDAKPASPAELRVKIARVSREHLEDVARAFEELGAALDAEPGHAGAVEVLEKLLASDDLETRARAGEMLEPVYLRRASWKEVKGALEARLAASHDPADRRELLTRLATLHEEQLEDYRAALETVAKLLHEDLSDEAVWRELERLAKVAGAEERLAEIYGAELEALPGDDGSSVKLCRRTGEIWADLGKVEAALTWYRRAHAFEPESRELFDAIDGLLVKGERHAERVALYTGALDYRTDPERIEALHTIAKLQRDELAEPEKAVDTLRHVLDVDDAEVRALDALTELYKKLGRDRELADLYLRRAEMATSGEQAAPFRLALAKLLRDKLGDVPGAIDQLEAIVGDVPWHSEAIKELEGLSHDETHKARVVEILRPLYERSDDWRMLVRLNEERFALATDDHEKVSVLRETAKLWETRGGDPTRAFGATTAAFDLAPEDGDTRTELERLAASLGAWEDLAESYEQGAQKTSDEVVKRELLGALAKLCDGKLDHPRRALDAYRRLAALDPTDVEPLDAMDTLAVLLSDWATVIGVLEKKSELASDSENAAIWSRIAETKLDMLEDEPGAIAAYERALELAPDETATIDALIFLYEEKSQAARLVELYARRVELAKDDEADLRYTLNLRAAERFEKELDNRREAIAALGAALDVRAGDLPVLRSLERLYRAESMWDELLDNLKLQANLAEAREARVALRTAIGDLYAKQLENPGDALEQYRLVLGEDASDAHAIEAAFAIGEERDELRADAVDVLEPVLRAEGKHELLVKALEMRLRAQTDPTERARTLRSEAVVLDVNLERASDALGALLRALEDTPDDATLHEEIEGIAARTDGYKRYADTLGQRAAAIFDAVVGKDLCVRLGRVAEEKLSDDRLAVESYAKAVEHGGDLPELLEALDRLYGRLKEDKALADILERRVAVVSGDAAQAELYHRLAKLQIDAFGDKPQGLGTLRLALERAPEHAAACEALEALADTRELFDEAFEILEGVYRVRADNAALAKLYEKRVGFAPTPGERVRMRLELARVLEERADDTKAAQAALEHALADDPTDPDVLAELERLAAVTTEWKKAATAFEAAILAREGLAADTACDLWVRLAGWRRDHVDDAVGAEKAFEKALEHQPQSEAILRSIEGLQRAPGREKDLVGTLRRLASLQVPGPAATDLRREAKTLAETVLADAVLAEAILREMVAVDDTDAWALSELAKLRDKAGDHEEVYKLLVRQSELAADSAAIRELRHEAAAVAREKLHDDARAVELYEAIFEDEPGDAKASGALRELYAKVGKSKDLLKLLERLVDLAESPAARSELRLEAAALCTDKLDDTREAAELLRAVLDEDAGNDKATLLLSQILEKTGRDDELAELLTTQIERAQERGDAKAELTYRVRLGEIAETRLGDVPKAIDTYRAVLERDPSHGGALLALARLYEQKGDKAEAARTLETILAAASGEEAVKTALRLADLYGALDDVDAARKALERGLAADGTAKPIRQRLLSLYEKQAAWTELADLVTGDANAASEAAEKVVLYRKAADIHLAKRSDPGSAADLLVKATELAPTDRELLLALCDAYSASGRGQQAAEVLQKIVESYGNRRSKDLAAIHHRLAKARLADGDKEKALADLDVAFKIDPGSIAILRDLGVLALELSEGGDDKAREGYLDRAQKTFRALLLQKLEDGSPITKAEVFYYLGEISHRQNDDKKAIQMLERSLDNDKNLAIAKDLLAKLKG